VARQPVDLVDDRSAGHVRCRRVEVHALTGTGCARGRPPQTRGRGGRRVNGPRSALSACRR
jgi:hypothetical protein